MSKYSVFEDNPINWVATQAAASRHRGASYDELGKILSTMHGNHPMGPYDLARAMVDRSQKPRLIRQPQENAMLYFREGWLNGEFLPSMTFSTHGDLNPKHVSIGSPMMPSDIFEHPVTNWSANIEGLDFHTGELCDRGACLPRSVFGASGDASYMNIYDSIFDHAMRENQEASSGIMRAYGGELSEIFGEGIDEISNEVEHFMDLTAPNYNVNGINTVAAAEWLRSGDLIKPFEHVPLPKSPSQLVRAQDFSTIESPESLQRMYNYIPEHYPNSVVFIRTKNNTGHAVGYRNGYQLRTHMGDAYDAENTERITDILAPKL